MAELTVAAVGLVGLASLFETCVNSVSYIKIARSFSADYQSLSFELELVQSRLYRWLEAVDISNNADFLEDKLLRSILANILNTLEEVRKVSSKYASEHSVAGPDAQQDDSIEVFRAKIADIIAFRQKSTSLVKKTTWALYHKEHFDTLISDTSRLVTQLIELFPASQARQTQLCAEEVLELSGGGDEVQLNEDAIKQSDHIYRDNLINGRARALLRDEIEAGAVRSSEGNLYERNTISGDARIKITNRWGAAGKDVFDD